MSSISRSYRAIVHYREPTYAVASGAKATIHKWTYRVQATTAHQARRIAIERFQEDERQSAVGCIRELVTVVILDEASVTARTLDEAVSVLAGWLRKHLRPRELTAFGLHWSEAEPTMLEALRLGLLRQRGSELSSMAYWAPTAEAAEHVAWALLDPAKPLDEGLMRSADIDTLPARTAQEDMTPTDCAIPDDELLPNDVAPAVAPTPIESPIAVAAPLDFLSSPVVHPGSTNEAAPRDSNGAAEFLRKLPRYQEASPLEKEVWERRFIPLAIALAEFGGSVSWDDKDALTSLHFASSEQPLDTRLKIICDSMDEDGLGVFEPDARGTTALLPHIFEALCRFPQPNARDGKAEAHRGQERERMTRSPSQQIDRGNDEATLSAAQILCPHCLVMGQVAVIDAERAEDGTVLWDGRPVRLFCEGCKSYLSGDRGGRVRRQEGARRKSRISERNQRGRTTTDTERASETGNAGDGAVRDENKPSARDPQSTGTCPVPSRDSPEPSPIDFSERDLVEEQAEGVEPKWARTARCAQHGLAFDFAEHSGCVLCRREGAAPPQKAVSNPLKAPLTRWTDEHTLAVVATVGIVVAIFLGWKFDFLSTAGDWYNRRHEIRSSCTRADGHVPGDIGLFGEVRGGESRSIDDCVEAYTAWLDDQPDKIRTWSYVRATFDFSLDDDKHAPRDLTGLDERAAWYRSHFDRWSWPRMIASSAVLRLLATGAAKLTHPATSNLTHPVVQS